MGANASASASEVDTHRHRDHGSHALRHDRHRICLHHDHRSCCARQGRRRVEGDGQSCLSWAKASGRKERETAGDAGEGNDASLRRVAEKATSNGTSLGAEEAGSASQWATAGEEAAGGLGRSGCQLVILAQGRSQCYSLAPSAPIRPEFLHPCSAQPPQPDSGGRTRAPPYLCSDRLGGQLPVAKL